MRVLYFSRGYSPHDHRFLSAISEAGHETLFLRLEQGSQSEDRPIPAAVKQLQWKGISAPFRWSEVPALAAAMRRLIRAHKPDLVHAGPVQTCAFITALSGFYPLLTMSWGYDLVQDVHRGRWWEWVTRYTLRRSTYFVSDAQVTRAEAVKYGMEAERTGIFPWGVDLEFFTPPEVKPAQKGKFVLFSNRAWEPLYGVEVLARAFVRIAGEHPEISLILLGSGSQATLLRQILLSGGALDRVFFGGRIPQYELPGWYHQADLYISTSHVDGSSVSLMEAMACGLPAVVSDIPGNREWVTGGKNGWLFKDGDVDDLAAKILDAINQRRSLPELGRRGRAVAEERADWKKNSQVLLQAYKTAVSIKAV